MSKHTLERIALLKQKREFIDEHIVKLEELVLCENRFESVLNDVSHDIDATVMEQVKTPNKVANIKVVSAKTSAESTDKPISLGSLIVKIVHESKKPLTLKQIAETATKSGYKSSAKNFGNNVYQAVNKLVKAKELKQTRENGEILYFAA